MEKMTFEIRPRGSVIRGLLPEGVCYPLCHPRGCVVRGDVLSEGGCYSRVCVILGGEVWYLACCAVLRCGAFRVKSVEGSYDNTL